MAVGWMVWAAAVAGVCALRAPRAPAALPGAGPGAMASWPAGPQLALTQAEHSPRHKPCQHWPRHKATRQEVLPAETPRPGAGQEGRRCPQCPQCAQSSNSSGPQHPSHSHARDWQGMCAGLLRSTWRGTQWLAAAISLCRSIACMASFPAHHRWPQGASFRTRYPKRAFLKGVLLPGGPGGGRHCKPQPRPRAAIGQGGVGWG